MGYRRRIQLRWVKKPAHVFFRFENYSIISYSFFLKGCSRYVCSILFCVSNKNLHNSTIIMDYKSRKQLKSLKNPHGFFRLKNPARAGKRVGTRVSTRANPETYVFSFILYISLFYVN